ncbi:MAG: FHA domain-containing protein [Pseudomonadota bacterium]
MDIPIDAVGRGRIEDQYIESLRHLADGTGGRFVHAQPDIVSLADGLTRIYRELMETQTVVAYFTYRPGSEQNLSEKVGIELLRPGADSLKGFLQAAIPVPEIEDLVPYVPPQRPKSIWEKVNLWLAENYVWLLAAALAVLLAALIIIIGRRNPKADQAAKEGQKIPPSVSAAKSPPIAGELSKPKVVAKEAEKISKPRRTQVGGYFPPPGPDSPAAILVAVGEEMHDQRFPVDKEVFYIGASPENDLFIQDDEYVSRNHAYLRYEKGSLLIVDQDSRNGTYVNNQRVSDAPQVVMPGDRIRVGNATFQVVEAPGR